METLVVNSEYWVAVSKLHTCTFPAHDTLVSPLLLLPQLPIKELRQNKRHKLEVTLYPQGKVQLVIEYYTSLASVGRKPAFLSSGVFGVPIEVVTE